MNNTTQENVFILLKVIKRHEEKWPAGDTEFTKLKTIPKHVTLKSKQYFIEKIPNKCEVQQIAFNHSSDTEVDDFMKIYRICTNELCSFSTNDSTLSSDDPVRLR